MKPHIYLIETFLDGGYTYEKWACSGGHPYMYGRGSSPRSAYLDWLGKRGEV